MREAVIVASSRTPLAKSHRGSFNMTRPDDLAAHAIKDVLGKAPRLDPKEVEEVILGCGQPHGPQGHNIARVAAIRAGLSVYTAGSTINRFCNSGLNAVVQACHMVMNEGGDVMIGGGCTIMAGVKIGERSFIAAGAVVTKDVPARSFVVGVPGKIRPLPANLDRPNNRTLTIQPLDLWHPNAPDLDAIDWPPHWGRKFRES
jgi:acetyl-CoA acetyltransferase